MVTNTGKNVMLCVVAFVLVLGIAPVARAHPSKADQYDMPNLQKLIHSDPRADFENAKKRGDFRFLGMLSYSLVVPGVPDYRDKYATVVDVKVIRGTSDAITSAEQARLFDALQRYEESYNRLVLEFIKTHARGRTNNGRIPR